MPWTFYLPNPRARSHPPTIMQLLSLHARNFALSTPYKFPPDRDSRTVDGGDKDVSSWRRSAKLGSAGSGRATSPESDSWPSPVPVCRRKVSYLLQMRACLAALMACRADQDSGKHLASSPSRAFHGSGDLARLHQDESPVAPYHVLLCMFVFA